LANILERSFTYVAEGVEEGHITFQRNVVPHVVMEKRQLLSDIHGELEICVEREFVKLSVVYHCNW